jgi:hypothetical protein
MAGVYLGSRPPVGRQHRIAAADDPEVAGDNAIGAELADRRGGERVVGSQHVERHGRDSELQVRCGDHGNRWVLGGNDLAVDGDRRA